TRSRLGLALGAFERRAEGRYLRERVMIRPRFMPRDLLRLEAAVDRGDCVSIVAELPAVRSTPAEMFGTPVGLAPGAPSLAWKKGVALLPVFCRRHGPLDWEVRVDAPLPAVEGRPRRRYVERSTRLFVSRLQSWVAASPADWRVWDYRRSFWSDPAAAPEEARRAEGAE
ncbi:MAG: hypothetical protein R3190_08530, partial [Thermoanaerobaculia bacterium]|nr:hypothetical protein [Thermoanaerobaculia bacterium]